MSADSNGRCDCLHLHPSQEEDDHMEEKFKFVKGKVLSSRFYPEFFPLKPDDRVINLGCGLGHKLLSMLNNIRK